MDLASEEMASGILFAHSLFTQGRYEESRIMLEGLLTLDPDNAYMHYLLGSTFSLQNRLNEATQAYSRSIELFPEYVSALVNRGEIYLKLGDFQRAAADLRKAVELDPQGRDSSAHRARFLLQMASGALRLAEEKGVEALAEAQEQIKKQLGES